MKIFLSLLAIFFITDYANNFGQKPFVSERKAALLRPVLIVPGLASNRLLQSRSSCFYGPRVWYAYSPTSRWNDCWISTIKLIYDNGTDTIDDGDGKIELDQFGWTNSMENLMSDLPDQFPRANVFRKMVNHLKTKGFVKGKTLFGIPQDWRKSVIPGLASNRLLQSRYSCFDGPRVW
ncbi:group XV phospholipase A2-like [Tetranychus urticae]|uniref:group XV phospholipase A2-like n=1 Tax=Tetranychus urticae TaxID=32264 RepID=UPI00077BBC8D|nr:group XV phospholipase A2-like [Tetranychus urticae]